MTPRSGMLNSSKRLRTRNQSKYYVRAKCHLLSLPAELRNIIYDLVIGGRTLHVLTTKITARQQKRTKRTTRIRVCRADPVDDAAATTIRHCQDVIYVPRCSHRHSACDTTDDGVGDPVHLSLSLLKTCLQIHSETHKLPFLTNTFSFCDGLAFGIWTKRLFPDQRSLVRSLVFNEHVSWGAWMDIKCLTNLSKVTIFNETWDFAWLGTEKRDAAKEQMRQKMLKRLQLFEFLKKLETATVCVLVKDAANREAKTARTDPSGFGRWSDDMEAKLLRSPEITDGFLT